MRARVVQHLFKIHHRDHRRYPCCFPVHQLSHLPSVKTVTINIDLSAWDSRDDLSLYPSRTSFRYPRRHRVLASYLQHLAYVLVFIPPILVGLVSALYGIRSIIAFNKSRTEFNELLSSHSNLTSSNYFRFMRIAGIQGVCAVPIGCHLLYYNAQGNALHPSVSWESAHGRLTTSLQSSGAQTP